MAVLRRARYLFGEVGVEFAEHRRYVDPHLLEDPAAHDRHDATAAAAAGALPRTALEAAGRQIGEAPGVLAAKAILQVFEGGADEVAQLLEPGLGAGLAVFQR